MAISLSNISVNLAGQNLLRKAERVLLLSLDLATLMDDDEDLFVMPAVIALTIFRRIGQWADAEAIWLLLDPMGRDWSRAGYRPGVAEYLLRSVSVSEGRFAGRASCRCRAIGN